jgi:outer membrane cobalamin receptor
MRFPLLVLVAIAPLDACSDTLVTAPAPPGPTPTIVIRGAKTPDGALIIVDGVVVGRGNINPADIEQIEVIKGPSAATLYGERRCPPIIIRTTVRSSVQAEQNAAKQ